MFSEGEAALPAAGMQAIPRQLADGLPEAAVRYGATVESVGPGEVVLAGGERIAGRRPSSSPPTARRRPGSPALVPAPGARGVTTLHYAAERSPVGEPLLVLDGEGEGPVNDLCVPSDVAPSYAPPGAALVSVTVLGVPPLDDAALDEAVRDQLRGWFGAQVDAWRLLRALRLPFALPAQPPAALTPAERPVRLREGLFVCGDHRDTASPAGRHALRPARRCRGPRPGRRALLRPLTAAPEPGQALPSTTLRHITASTTAVISHVAAVVLARERDDGPGHAHERRRDEHDDPEREIGRRVQAPQARPAGPRAAPRARAAPPRPRC